jgi:putative ABC transport system permease protein
VVAVAPVVQTRKTVVSQSSNWSTNIQGSTTGWLTTNARSVQQGNFFTDTDVSRHSTVAVLGSTTATNLGVGVGDSVTIGPTQFQVVGILAQSGGFSFQNGDDLAVVPITTTQDVLTGGNPNSVQRILISAFSSATVGSAYQEANQLLLVTHRVTDPAAADFTIQSQSSFLSTAQQRSACARRSARPRGTCCASS